MGVPQTFETCTKIVRPYGNIANAGVHGKPVELPLNTMWISNVRINMGLVNCNTVGNPLNMVRSGRLNAKAMATHRFTFDQFEEAYDLFRHPRCRAQRGEGCYLLQPRGCGIDRGRLIYRSY